MMAENNNLDPLAKIVIVTLASAYLLGGAFLHRIETISPQEYLSNNYSILK